LVLSKTNIEALLKIHEEYPLECDGYCRLAAHYLATNDIEHSVKYGEITSKVKNVGYHCWIEVGDVTIDYKARMWLGDSESIPHGLFTKKDYPSCRYHEQGEHNFTELSPVMISILTTPW
jgi:hypothetical protein